MDLKKSEKTALEAIKAGAATIAKIVEETAYKERTVKAALKKLNELKLVDFLEGEDGEKIYFEIIQEGENIQDCEIILPYLRKIDFLNIQEGDAFTFNNKNWVVESVIEQRPIAGKPFLKMLATTGVENVQFTVNLGRPSAPISIKEL
jgi:DNA-binding MarR family transcriptional regulator